MVAISDEDISDYGDEAVKSDIAPRRGRGRKLYKEPEVVDNEEYIGGTKKTNGDAAEDDQEEDEEDEDLEEDEYDLVPPPCLLTRPTDQVLGTLSKRYSLTT